MSEQPLTLLYEHARQLRKLASEVATDVAACRRAGVSWERITHAIEAGVRGQLAAPVRQEHDRRQATLQRVGGAMEEKQTGTIRAFASRVHFMFEISPAGAKWVRERTHLTFDVARDGHVECGEQAREWLRDLEYAELIPIGPDERELFITDTFRRDFAEQTAAIDALPSDWTRDVPVTGIEFAMLEPEGERR